MIDIDAAGKPALVLRHQPRDFTRTRDRIDAADQKALAAARGKEVERIVDAERPAGQRHDAVGIARGRGLGHRHLVDERKKIRAEQRHGETQDHQQGTPPATAGGDAARVRASSAPGPEPMASISPDLPANDNAKSGA